MNGLKEICVCGHDVETHFKDPRTGVRGRCLGMHCDECYRYRDALSAYRDTPVMVRFETPLLPHPPWCLCSDCCEGF